MSSPQGSGDPTENEADVDLKGVIKDLQDEIKALNKLLKTFGKGIQSSNKVTKMGVKDHLLLIKAQGDMVKSNADYKKSLQDGSDSMSQFASALQNGFSPIQMFLGVAKKMGGLTTELDDFKKKSSEFAEMQKDMGVTDPKSKKFATLSDEDKQKYMDKSAEVDEANKKREGAFGGKGGLSGKLVEGMSSMKKFAEKHATGFIIGAGSVGILLLILKKAFSASPMFQQMMKLLNFGIMMILRPIGDFFGFLMRPIMVMLLRKFIIPWYTKMYPVMMKMGNLIGEKLSGAFQALAEGDVVAAFALLFAGVDFKKILGDAFAGIHTWIEETDWEKVWLDIQAGLLAFGTGIWDYIIKPIGEAIYAELREIDWGAAIWDTIKLLVPVMAVGDFIAGLLGVGNNKWFNEWGRAVRDWFITGLDEATTEWDKFFTNISDWFTEGLKSATTNWTNFFESIKQGILDNMGLGFLINENDRINSDNYNNNQLDPEPQKNWWEIMGNGGHITEPIAGVGRSGKHYLLGEAGNETVIPDDQLGGGNSITINIQNMSGSQLDLNNLRQTILDVVQESSSRRGRA